jgi:hypothetical protein
MPNRNYINGRAYEYKAKQLLEAQGYTTIRTAGSHGPYDLLAMKSGEKVRCIQIKRTKAPGGSQRLLRAFQRAHPTPTVDQAYVEELWVWYAGKWSTTVL